MLAQPGNWARTCGASLAGGLAGAAFFHPAGLAFIVALGHTDYAHHRHPRNRPASSPHSRP